MDEILNFDWNDPADLKVNLEKWAYNDHFYLMEEDEDLLFHDIAWTEIVFPFMFDEKCCKRVAIIGTFSNFIRILFLRRESEKTEQIEKMFIDPMAAYYSKTGDDLIGNCVNYYRSCKLKSVKK